MEKEFTGTIEDAINGSQFLKIIFHSLQHNHSLTVFILYHRILFKRFRKYLNFRKRTDGTDPFIPPVKDFTLTDSDFQLRIECRKETSYHILKSIKNGKCTDQCKCSKSYSAHRNAGYDINSIMLLFREKITLGYIEGKIHLCNELFHFNNESIFSI
jgi:hypothetical protein